VAGGARGQRLVVAPSQDLVVVMTGGGPAEEDIEQVVLETVGSYLLPAVRSEDPLPESPEGMAALVAATPRAASVDRERAPVAPLPAELGVRRRRRPHHGDCRGSRLVGAETALLPHCRQTG